MVAVGWRTGLQVFYALILWSSASVGLAEEVIELPAPVSPPSMPSTGFRAAAEKVDITPPPGLGMSGMGPAARISHGYRCRLHVRALAMEDASGEKILLLVADLPFPSTILHRLTAERLLREGSGIGADRLILSATHTHSAPGNFADACAYNTVSGTEERAGYDPALVTFLVDRFVQAGLDAMNHLEPAQASWDALWVGGMTRNRSVDAFRFNDPLLKPVDLTAPDSKLQFMAVDSVWTMLRIDRQKPDGTPEPMAALSLFAIHGTANPLTLDLYESDIHGLMARALEDSLKKYSFVHLVANGASGDVSPNLSESARCDLSYLDDGRWPVGPRSSYPPEIRNLPDLSDCLEKARKEYVDLGRRLGERARKLYSGIRTGPTPDLNIRRASTTLDLKHLNGSFLLANDALSGMPTYVGAEDGRTPLYHWKYLGIFPSNFEEGGRAIKHPPSGPHGSKAIGLSAPVQKLVVTPVGFPDHVTLSAVEIGPMTLLVVPGEVTTEASLQMRYWVAQHTTTSVSDLRVLSLSNSYIQYVTTANEYDAQNYEGGSDIYGPNTCMAIAEQLVPLVRSLNGPEQFVEVAPITAHPGPFASYFPRPSEGDSRPSYDNGQLKWKREFTEQPRWKDQILTARWRDYSPGRFPSDEKRIDVQVLEGDSWVTVVQDDSPEVEVRVYKWSKSNSEWEVRWIHDLTKARIVVRDLTGSKEDLESNISQE